MSPQDRTTTADVSLDTLAIHAFVREMMDSLEGISLACLSDTGGNILWSQEFDRLGFAPDACVSDSRNPLTEPVKRALGQHDSAYHYPLTCTNISGVVFTLVLHSVDPPNLASVTFAIESMLACLSRQIDLDCALTTSEIALSSEATTQSPTRQLEALTSGGNLEDGLNELARACMEEYPLDAIAIAIPDSRIRVVLESELFSQRSAHQLLAKLHQPLGRKRRVISARLSLEDGRDGYVVCAPVMRDQKAIQGIVLVVSAALDVANSNLVRAIAKRISALVQMEPGQSKLLSRFELTTKIDEIIHKQPKLPHSLAYFDADKMHTINDAFGYAGGDRALATFRRILSASAGANDLIAHLGSDRFAMFMPGASGDTALSKAAQILRSLSQEAIDDRDKSINLSASAGIVDTQAASKGAEDMLILAEVASRGAQDRGGNQCALFQDLDSSIIQRRSDVDKVGFLQMALIENQFVLHAQRIQALGQDSGQKYELLARLRSENGPDRSPAEFLSAAERYQLMSALDRWVINSALSSIAGAENTLEVSLTTFSINVSAQSLQDDAFIEFVESRIAQAGIPPDTLCFELTETSLVRNIDRAQRFVHRMQRLGCQVALDDFGTGYSSFAYLKALPVNYLKIDGAFVRDILENELSKAIVSSVVTIAAVIGAQTVAEHVENPMVQTWLKNAGVHYVQGFSVHKPEPLLDVLSAMDSHDDLTNTAAYLDLRQPADGAVTESSIKVEAS